MNNLTDRMRFIDEIIDYWKNVEFLSQDEAVTEGAKNRADNEKAKKGVKDKSGKNLLIKQVNIFHDITDESDINQFLEQDKQEYSLYPVMGKCLYYCLGSIKREKCTALIEKLIGEDSELRPEKESDRITWFAFRTSTDGTYEPESLSISPVIWVIDVLSKQKGNLSQAISLKNYKEFVKSFENRFVNNREKISVSDIRKIYKAFYHMYIQPYFNDEPWELFGKLVYFCYCSFEEKEKVMYETDYSCLWKSFIFYDLELVQKEIREGRFGNNSYENNVLDYILAPYSDEIMKNRRMDISPESEVNFLKSFFMKNLDIRKAPLGKWPSKYMPALMQQVAVNLFTGDENSRIFSVNGPPGTGKTTMLKEIIVNNIVERARLFAEDKSEYSDEMFERCAFEYGSLAISNGYNQEAPYYYRLKNDKINDYGILVTSCNNAAVENITKELPDGKSIISSLEADENDSEEAADGLREVQELFRVKTEAAIKEDDEDDIYFTQYARSMTDMSKVWGLISAPLGKRRNIDNYRDKVLKPFLENNTEQKRNLHRKRYLEAKEKFCIQLEKVEAMREEMGEVCDYELEFLNVPLREDYNMKIECYNQELQQKSQEYTYISSNIDNFNDEKLNLQKEISQDENDIMDLEDSRSWNDRISSFFGKKTLRDTKIEQKKSEYSEKIQKLNTLESAIKEYEVSVKEKAEEVDRLKKELEKILSESSKTERMREYIQERLKQVSHGDRSVIPFDDEFMRLYLSDDEAESTKAQVSNPWFTQQYNREREKLFYYACILNKEFVLSSKSCMHNVINLMSAWIGDIDWRDLEKAYPVFIQTLFLITPVISTTFASVQRFLKDVKHPGMLGTLIIDEAGQAAPQMALGAMFRCRKCIVVGDPKQIEPVVTDEVDMLKKVIATGPLATYRNKSNSVQVFADKINPYGTYLGEDTEKIWIGCPLVVHRRCISPMYNISNTISYNHTMKQKTLPPKPEKIKNFCYEKSCWIDVKGFEREADAKNHFIEEQGEVVLKILDKAFSISDNPNMFIISPFNSVVREMISKIKQADFVKKYGSKDNKVLKWLDNKDKKRVGTVHSFQGREADEVIFLLGCDKKAKGAVRWVNSNIVNVAATRAKYRVYFIGDKDVWEASAVVNEARQIIGNEIKAESEYETKIFQAGYESDMNENRCPECNGKLVLKHNSKDGSKFYGCINYPDCMYTVNVNQVNNSHGFKR